MIKWYSRKGFLSVDTGNCYLNPLLDCLLTYMIGTYIPTCIWSFLHEDNLHLCEILVVSGHGLWTIVIVLKAFQFDSCNQWELCTFLYFFFKHTTHFMKVGLLVTSVIYIEGFWLKNISWCLHNLLADISWVKSSMCCYEIVTWRSGIWTSWMLKFLMNKFLQKSHFDYHS